MPMIARDDWTLTNLALINLIAYVYFPNKHLPVDAKRIPPKHLLVYSGTFQITQLMTIPHWCSYRGRAMLTTLDELSHILQTYHIDAEGLDELEIDTASMHAFALAIDPAQELDVWHIFRALVPQTQCYPLLVEDWASDRAFFSPYWYEEEQSAR